MVDAGKYPARNVIGESTLTMITGKQNIDNAQYLVRKSALSLEILGMKSRGGSVYALCKREYGLKGSKQKVFDQMQDYASQHILGRSNDE